MKQYCLSFLFLITFFGINQRLQAQCLPPTSATTNLTNITCAGSGAIEVTSLVTSGGTSTTDFTNYRFILYNNASPSTIVRAEQDSGTFSGLDSGTYVLHIHQLCSPGVSADFMVTLTLTGYYVRPVLGTPAVTAPTCSGGGTITATASKGSGAYEYCLVDSLNAPLIPAHFVSPRQIGNSFSGLASGDYFLRVYDQCNGFVTTRVTVPVGIPAGDPIDNVSIDDESCDSFYLIGVFNRQVPRDANLIWWQFPDGTVDTIKTSTYAGNATYLTIPKSKLAAYYPATITLYYTNECGIVFHDDMVIRQPELAPSASMTADGYNCSQGSFSIGDAYMLDTANHNHPIGGGNIKKWDSYSLDGGLTWIPYNVNDTVLIDKGTSRDILYQLCGTVYTIHVNMPAGMGTLEASLFAITGMHCDGMAGIGWDISDYNGRYTDIKVHVAAKPATQPSIPDFYLGAGTTNNYRTSSYMMNIVPGTYTLIFTDACGSADTQTITVAGDRSVLSAVPIFACGSATSSIAVFHDGVRNIPASLGYEVTDSSGAVISSHVMYGDYTDTVSGLTPGLYTVRIWLVDYDDLLSTDSVCGTTVTVDTRIEHPLALDRSLFALCTNNPSAGTIIAQPTAGKAPYSYSLYRGNISDSTLVAGPQSSDVFSGLTVGTKFYVTVTDACGAGASYTNSFGSVTPVLTPSIDRMPCEGDSITLSVQGNASLFYQWLKNGSDIPGATDTVYSINPVSAATNGIYQVQINANSCLLLSKPITLDISACGSVITLPLDLLNFSGTLTAQRHASLTWSIGSPENSAYFDVLYSTDGKDFYTAGRIMQDGQTSTFNFVHNNYTVSAKTFYKLKLVNKNGESHYSNMLMLQADKSEDLFMTIMPVPFDNYIRLQYAAAEDSPLELAITDIAGRNMRNVHTAAHAGINTISVDNLDALPHGIYLLTVTDAAGKKQRIKIQK